MSGPKTTRYRLTEEQRRIMQENRLRERERVASLAFVASCHEEALGILTFCHDCASLLQGLFTAGCEDGGLAVQLEKAQVDAKALLNASLLPSDTPYEEAIRCRRDAEAASLALKAVIDEAKELAEEGKAHLKDRLEDAVDRGFATSFEELERTTDKRRLLFAARLDDMTANEKLPISLLAEVKQASLALQETDESRLSDWEAITLLPLEERAEKALEEYEACVHEYKALRAEYEAVSSLRESEPVRTECTREGLFVLRKALEEASAALAIDDEEGYIAECIDTVMQEFGYHVVGARTHEKKSGRRFHHELYTYKDGTVVDVTTADDGKITMELGAPDRVDRLPTKEETRMLCDIMEDFCTTFAEIEARLAEMGVVVGDKIRHLPPTPDHAEIINIDEYCLTEELPTETKKQEKQESGAAIRRRQRKRKVFRRTL